ncbi:MAG: hypothetical protein WCV99_14050 [Sterolibacterium sp.]
MTASVVEQILARVATVLTNATDAADRVERGRVDAVAIDDQPTLNIRRSGSTEEPRGDKGGVLAVAWDIEHLVAVDDAWETAVDALHMQVHAVLAADTTLAALGRGLRCSGTDPQGDSGERVIGRLTARYQMQVFIRPGDLTRAIN